MGFGPIVEGSSPSPPAINFEMNVSGVILAAGKGTRMKSNLPKVLHTVSGKKLISYALEVIEDINNKYVVVGHEAKKVMEALPESLNFVIQEEQKGTGHAISILLEDKKFADDTSEYILVLPGDVPMINSNDIKNLIKKVTDSSSTHKRMSKNRLGGSALTTVFSQIGDETADMEDPLELKRLFNLVQILVEEGIIIAGHDR